MNSADGASQQSRPVLRSGCSAPKLLKLWVNSCSICEKIICLRSGAHGLRRLRPWLHLLTGTCNSLRHTFKTWPIESNGPKGRRCRLFASNLSFSYVRPLNLGTSLALYSIPTDVRSSLAMWCSGWHFRF